MNTKFALGGVFIAALLTCQVSAAHERNDLDRAVEAFRKVGRRFEVLTA